MTVLAQEIPPLPETPVQEVADVVHGVSVPDPYRWLEDGASPEVQKWADAQDAHTRATLDRFSGRDRIRKRIEELSAIGRVMNPVVRKGRIFFQKRTAMQNQPVLYVKQGLAGGPRPLLDPNTLSADATVALDWWSPSEDGKLLAFGTSESGSEISTLQVLEVDSGARRPESIPYCRAASPSWLSDGSGFYYARYPAPGTVPAGEEKYHRRIWFHALGTDPKSDPPVFGEGRTRKEDWPDVRVSHDDRWLLASVFEGWSRSELYLQARGKEGQGWTPMVEGREATYTATILKDKVYIRTNDGAPRGRIMVADCADPGRERWRELIPEGDGTLETFEIAGGKIIARELHRASSRLRVFSLEGKPEGEIPLPALGSVDATSAEWDGNDFLFDFDSFFAAPSLCRYDVVSGKVEVWEKIEAEIDGADFETRQVEYPSRDGTKITMFVIHRKGLERTGDAPALLSGYGGFNISMTPNFSASLVTWLEAGGVYALPNLRGGGEYGEAWHQAGMLDRKQNVFDDFVAAAEWLVREKYTRPERLAISGGSNGGLLVGAALTQRPDLFRAVACAVPLLDMVRYHKFLIARLWIPEYGSAEDPAQFKTLWGYSPYHHVKDGTKYPAVLLLTADTDTRVDPLHARKMAARLQQATASDRPVLLRVEKKAGHGAGKPLSKAIDETTDLYCFLMEQLGMKP